MAKKTPTPSAGEASPPASGKAAPSAANPGPADFPGLLSDEELKQLARDIASGHVFIDRLVQGRFEGQPDAQQREAQLLRTIFMPLGLADDELLAQLVPTCGMLYEYYAKALPRGINGDPMFGSMRVLHRDQLDPLHTYVAKIQAALADL